MSDLNVTELRRLAMLADRPWKLEPHGMSQGVVFMYWINETTSIGAQNQYNAEDIGALDPGTVLKLIAAYEAMNRGKQ